jgi:hypothetical protein
MENESLLADLVAWVAETPKPYHDVMAAWRTSCPRLTIWEDAVGHGLVRRERGDGNVPMVAITAEGRTFLKQMGREM